MIYFVIVLQTLAITLGGLSISIIKTSFDYSNQIDLQRQEMIDMKEEYFRNPTTKSLDDLENEEELNNVILYNLEQIANVFLL